MLALALVLFSTVQVGTLVTVALVRRERQRRLLARPVISDEACAALCTELAKWYGVDYVRMVRTAARQYRFDLHHIDLITDVVNNTPDAHDLDCSCIDKALRAMSSGPRLSDAIAITAMRAEERAAELALEEHRR